MTDAIDQIRAFNRRYLVHMGLLSRGYLDSDLSPTQARVLYELCEGGEATSRDLAQRLDIDEGYLSRIVDQFASRGWVERRRSPEDARRRIIAALPAGRTAFAPFKDRSRQDIARRLGQADPERVAAAAVRVEMELTPIDPTRVTLRDLAVGDAGWLIQRHGELYALHEGFDETFEPLVAEILVDFMRNRDPESERAWIAEFDGQRLGSIFCVRSGETGIAKLRLFLIEPMARGLGLGQRLICECINFARATGNHTLRLWTHESHRAACALYQKNGFNCTAAVPVTSFGVDLVEQTWELDLT